MTWLRFATPLAMAACALSAAAGAVLTPLWLALLAFAAVLQAGALYRRYRDD